MDTVKIWIINIASNDPTMVLLIMVIVLFIGFVLGVRSGRIRSIR